MIHRRGSTEEEEEGGGISSGRREEDYYIDLIDELFGISAVVDYVGATSSLIAPIINGMLFGIAATPGARIPAVARRRMVDIAIYLQERARPYVCGEVSADEYASSCRREAHFVLQEGGRSGGEESTAALLWIIGTTLLEEADQHAGGAMVPMSFVRKTLLETTRRVRSTFSNARIYAPISFVPHSRDLRWEEEEEEEGPEATTVLRRHPWRTTTLMIAPASGGATRSRTRNASIRMQCSISCGSMS